MVMVVVLVLRIRIKLGKEEYVVFLKARGSFHSLPATGAWKFIFPRYGVAVLAVSYWD
jgi:hypothetical protein